MKLFSKLPHRSDSDTFLEMRHLEIFKLVLSPPVAARLLVMLLIFKAALELEKEDRIRTS